MAIEHDWQYVPDVTTPSGKILYRCTKCGAWSIGPVKAEYETSRCELGLYEGKWVIRDGKLYIV